MRFTHNNSCCNPCCEGPQGKIGPQGPPGEMGPQGPAGSGVQPVYFNAVIPGGFQTISPEGDVNFLIAYQSGDFSFTPNTAEITVNTGGVYRIDYSLLIRPASGLLNIAYAVAINGLENPTSTDYLAGTGIDNQAVNHASILLQRIA